MPQTPPDMHHCGIKPLVHLLNEAIDMILTVTKVSTFNEVLEFAGAESTSWVRELEWPEEVIDLLEIWANRIDLVNNIFYAYDSILSKRFLDESVVGER